MYIYIYYAFTDVQTEVQAEVCLVGLWVGANYVRQLFILYHLYLLCNTASSF